MRKHFETDNDLQSFPLLDPSMFYASLDLPCYCNVVEHDI